jgi:glycosyltransferase involved in cell wall biosynthesis
MTKVSIVIPVFNCKEMVEEMILCIINQTYRQWELLLVDDGSTGETLDMLNEFSRKDERIKIFQRQKLPKGASACRNIGLQNVEGEYIILFDSDDLISNTCIENRVKFIENNPDIDYAIFPGRTFRNEEDIQNKTNITQFYGIDRKEDDLSSFLKTDYPFGVWNNIYRKDSITHYKWDEHVLIYNDFAFMIPMILDKLVYRYSPLKEYDYYYRTNYSKSAITSNQVTPEKIESTYYLLSKTINSLKILDNSSKYIKDYFLFFLYYFHRLLMDSNLIEINKFIIFCSLYYKKSNIIKLRIISFLSRNIDNRKIKSRFIRLLFAIFFVNLDAIHLQ